MQEILDTEPGLGKALLGSGFGQPICRSGRSRREDSLDRMRYTWRSMVETSDGYASDRRSPSGLVGGDGGRMRDYMKDHEPIGGNFLGRGHRRGAGHRRVQRLYAPDRGGTHCRCLRCDARSADPSVPLRQGQRRTR